MYLIDRPQPSKELIRARDLAGKAIEQMMRENSPGGESSPKGFHWVKTDWTYPSFEHFTFAYKNAVFPVFVELLEDGRSLMTTNERSRFLDAARKNNLIPCTYRINVEYKKISSWKIWEPPKKDKSSFSLTAFSSGWNLWDIRDNSAVNPMELGDDSNVEMSEWEIIDFCVQIVRNYLKKERFQIESYCSLPEIQPQIWFRDHDGRICWCIVRYIANIEDDDYHKWIGTENDFPQIKQYDGYYAGVSLASAAPELYDKNGKLIPLSERFTGKAPLYRGDGMYARFLGLKRVYVTP